MITKWIADPAYGNTLWDALFWVNPETLDDKCRDQIMHLQSLPFARKHIAVMPDAHGGYGMPIGCVLATKDVVVPNAVGVDIGCGMIACRLKGMPRGSRLSDDKRRDIRERILANVKVGKSWNEEPCDWTEMPMHGDMGTVYQEERDRARYQLGTLGGGNHFIEVQADQEDTLWVMIHSGSRNLGYKTCNHWNRIATEENNINFSAIPKSWDLAFFHKDSRYFKKYIRDMELCIEFARRNREHILCRVIEALKPRYRSLEVDRGSIIDICHNHASVENHMGDNLIVHRKGVAGPYRGNLGIIPGSMGSTSYIVEHTGNVASYLSTSHGAGRSMSRTDAKNKLDIDLQQEMLETAGVACDMSTPDKLDEAPGAYKDIEEVMANQADLCRMKYILRPLVSVKG